MPNYWYPSDILALRDDLIAFAWSAPLRTLAGQLDLSDVGLKKLLTSYGGATPPQRYWNKLNAGKPVPRRPKAPARRPGEAGRVRLPLKFRDHVPLAEPISSQGPFASDSIPEALDDLLPLELKAVGKVTAPRNLDRPHLGLRDLLRKEERRRAKVASTRWHWDRPAFDDALSQRRLRIFNGLLMALAKRGNSGSVMERDSDLVASATVGDTSVSLQLVPSGMYQKVRIAGYERPDPTLPATTPLTLTIEPRARGEGAGCWHDDGQGKIESKLAEIVAAIIVAGERRFRLRLAEAEERERERLIVEDRRRAEDAERLNQQRLASLLESGELLRKAQALRALVDEVRVAIRARSEEDYEQLDDWATWALAEADKLDPVRSEQFLTHFHPPRLS